jgi:hypothetical protein
MFRHSVFSLIYFSYSEELFGNKILEKNIHQAFIRSQNWGEAVSF